MVAHYILLYILYFLFNSISYSSFCISKVGFLLNCCIVFYFTIIYLVFLDMIKVVSKLITNNAKQKCFMHAILHICENSFKKFLEVDYQVTSLGL